MENQKSLLELLKNEDKLKYDVKFNSETYETLKFKEKNERLASEYKEYLEESKQELLNCRKEIAQYLKFLEALVKEDEGEQICR